VIAKWEKDLDGTPVLCVEMINEEEREYLRNVLDTMEQEGKTLIYIACLCTYGKGPEVLQFTLMDRDNGSTLHPDN